MFGIKFTGSLVLFLEEISYQERSQSTSLPLFFLIERGNRVEMKHIEIFQA